MVNPWIKTGATRPWRQRLSRHFPGQRYGTDPAPCRGETTALFSRSCLLRAAVRCFKAQHCCSGRASEPIRGRSTASAAGNGRCNSRAALGRPSMGASHHCPQPPYLSRHHSEPITLNRKASTGPFRANIKNTVRSWQSPNEPYRLKTCEPIPKSIRVAEQKTDTAVDPKRWKRIN